MITCPTKPDPQKAKALLSKRMPPEHVAASMCQVAEAIYLLPDEHFDFEHLLRVVMARRAEGLS